ncbi:MAG: hypothetical protein OEQ13_05550 [Acidobacteriota bacterium]|nr:hypothetical protein [Acidobacteriota bacterium]
MKTARSTTFILGVPVLIAGLGLIATGCTDNRAGEAVRAEVPAAQEVSEAVPVEVAAEAIAIDGSVNGVVVRERELEERERTLQKREVELARAQAELATSVRALTKKIDAVDAVDDAVDASSASGIGIVEPRDSDDANEETAGEVPTFPRRLGAGAENLSATGPGPGTVLIELPAATTVAVELQGAVSSEASVPGDAVAGRVAEDVVQGGLVVIPAGASVSGSVVDAVRQKKIGGQARLVVVFDRLELPSGDVVPIEASFVAEGKKQTKRDAATIGGATAGGALLGRILKDDDRDKGTLVGAILGAAVGAAVASNNEADPIALEPGAVAVAALDVPVRIAVTDPAATALAQMD